MGGINFAGDLHDVWRTTDGDSWTKVTDAGWPGRYAHAAAVFDDKTWVMGGSLGDEHLRFADVWWSSDGSSWTCADSAAWPPRGYHSALAYDSLLWVAGGDTTSGYLTMSDVWCSAGLGVEESLKPQASNHKPGPTIVRGVLSLPSSLLAANSSLLSIDGRKVMDLAPGANDVRALAPGVYFVRQASDVKREASRVTKVVVAR
jgi:hypothetical protein